MEDKEPLYANAVAAMEAQHHVHHAHPALECIFFFIGVYIMAFFIADFLTDCHD